MKYVKPVVLHVGKSEDVIQGDCGWGAENWTLDKTGAYHTTRRKEYLCGVVGNPALGGYEFYCCHDESACSTSGNDC